MKKLDVWDFFLSLMCSLYTYINVGPMFSLFFWIFLKLHPLFWKKKSGSAPETLNMRLTWSVITRPFWRILEGCRGMDWNILKLPPLFRSATSLLFLYTGHVITILGSTFCNLALSDVTADNTQTDVWTFKWLCK